MNKAQEIKQYLRSHKKLAVVALAVMVVVLVALYQNNQTSYGDQVTEESYAMGYGGSDMDYVAANTVSRGMMSGDDGGYTEPPYIDGEALYDTDVERQLIRTGSLSITVRNIRDTRTAVEDLVEQHGGFVASEYFSDNSYYNEYGRKESTGYRGSMTLRIPTVEYDTTMQGLRDMALVVEREHSNVQDVTEQYYDLEARIENKREQEQQYQAIMARADEVSDVLEVTKYLSEVRGEIERLEGQLNRLSNQVELSTIELEIASEDTVRLGGSSWNPGDSVADAWHNMVRSVVALLDALIALVVYLPLLAVYALGLWLVYLVVRKAYEWFVSK